MTVSPGSRLGPYEVLASLGAGGMGEVYRARDTRLDREVAIKVLPTAFATDTDRVMRFEREAKTLAALNHPHIAHIYGIEESHMKGGPSGPPISALVMELVEGETLADRIARGPIPLDEALPMARQIAEALEAAHDAGIIHRDLKPANVKVRDDGTVKVLDFGLAKVDARSGDPSGLQSPTFTSPATVQGVILGTAAYMAPEQAKGKPIDRRADMWAFGCVLFEMLTGKRAFAGEDITDTLTAIMRDEPDWTTLPASTPTTIHRLLRRCLSKDRARRLQSAADARLEIEDALSAGPISSTPATPATRSPLAVALGVAVVLSALVGAYVLGNRAAPDVTAPAPVTRFVIPAPPGTQIVSGHRELAISTDGRHVAFIARGAADQHIYVRRLDELTTRQIAGTEGARDLAFSPDARWLAFHSGTKIRKVSVDGGVPTVLADAVHSHGLAWHPSEDAIYFAPHQLSAIWKVQADGGSPAVQITTLDSARSERSHEWPTTADEGRTLIFSVNANGADVDEETVSVLTLATNARHTVRTGGTAFVLTDRGELLYVRMGSLMSARYGDGRLDAPTILEPAAASERVAFSPNGTLVFVPEPDYKRRSLVWISPDGRMTDAGFGERAFGAVALSPDGRRAAIRIVDDRDNVLYTADVGGGALTPLATPGPWIPAWSPDGKSIAGTVRLPRVDSSLTVSRIPTEAGRNWEVLVDGFTEDNIVTQWTPDGRGLLFSGRDPGTGRRSVMRLAIDVTPPETSTVVNSVGDHIAQSASVSPDGRWLAYESNESGRLEVYVQGYPTPTARIQASREGGSWPQWSKRGDALYFRAGSALLTSAVTINPELRIAAPRVIVNEPLLAELIAGAKPFDVGPDGRILAIKEDGSVRSDHVVVVQNWLSEVRTRHAETRR